MSHNCFFFFNNFFFLAKISLLEAQLMHWSGNKLQPCLSPRWAPFAPWLPSGCLCTSGSRASRVSSLGKEDRGDGLKCKPVQSPTPSWLGLSQAMVETHRGLLLLLLPFDAHTWLTVSFPSLRCLSKWFQYWGCWELLEDSKLTLKGKLTFH